MLQQDSPPLVMHQSHASALQWNCCCPAIEGTRPQEVVVTDLWSDLAATGLYLDLKAIGMTIGHCIRVRLHMQVFPVFQWYTGRISFSDNHHLHTIALINAT